MVAEVSRHAQSQPHACALRRPAAIVEAMEGQKLLTALDVTPDFFTPYPQGVLSLQITKNQNKTEPFLSFKSQRRRSLSYCLRAKRESGAHLSIRIGGNARAAPATVSGEPPSKCATDAVRHWEGQTAVMTREPGNVLGRGVPVCRLQRLALA